MVHKLDIIKNDDFQHIYQVDVFAREYRKLFKKNDSEFRQEQEKLFQNLTILDTQLQKALELQQFERLTNHRPLCAIRHVSKTNPRVIFVFAESDDAIVLLACTLEKDTSDYDQVIARAVERLRILEED